MAFGLPKKPTKNWGLKDKPSWMPQGKPEFKNMQTAYRRKDVINLSELKSEIDIVDGQISREVANMQMKLRRQPTDAEIRQSPRVNSLLTRRDELVGAYSTVVQQHKYYNAKLQKMQSSDPLGQAKQNFAGIRRKNPFTEFKRTPVQVPTLTPQHRLQKNLAKRGTQWDPNFSLNDVSVNPKIKNYYKKYIRW